MDAKRSADKRARVLAAGESVFLRQGYARTTMGDLALAAGMSRPALYLVYARKHQLFAAIIQDESRCASAGRAVRSETDALQYWMTWACDLWLGETVTSEEEGAACLNLRSESSPREVAFLQSILQDGLGKRLPWAVDDSICASVARLLTFCVCGLLDSRVGSIERKALLAVQIDALTEAALRPDEADGAGFRGPSSPARAKRVPATASAMVAR